MNNVKDSVLQPLFNKQEKRWEEALERVVGLELSAVRNNVVSLLLSQIKADILQP